MRYVVVDDRTQIIRKLIEHIYVEFFAGAADLEFRIIVEGEPAGLPEAAAPVEITAADAHETVVDSAVRSLILGYYLLRVVLVNELLHGSLADASVTAVAPYREISQVHDVLKLPYDEEAYGFGELVDAEHGRTGIYEICYQITLALREGLFIDLLENRDV